MTNFIDKFNKFKTKIKEELIEAWRYNRFEFVVLTIGSILILILIALLTSAIINDSRNDKIRYAKELAYECVENDHWLVCENETVDLDNITGVKAVSKDSYSSYRGTSSIELYTEKLTYGPDGLYNTVTIQVGTPNVEKTLDLLEKELG